MLKKFKVSDIDTVMNLWKKEFFSKHRKNETKDLTQSYTEVKEKLLDKNNTTILYTEDDVIDGFISFNKNSEIYLVYVKESIRREGIGTVLINACKKKCNALSASVKKDDEICNKFFQKNEFIINEADDNNVYTWTSENKEKISVIYFDDDIKMKTSSNESKVEFKQIKIKDIIKNNEVKDVKTYLKIRKLLETAFKNNRVLLYINYNNYYAQIDDIIKEIVKMKKTKFAIIICEPLTVESFKYKDRVKEIEQSYEKFNIYKINTEGNIKENISINKILDEKMKTIICKIEEIAENM